MRAYTLALLSKLTPDGTKIEDKDIINWVNNKVSSLLDLKHHGRGSALDRNGVVTG